MLSDMTYYQQEDSEKHVSFQFKPIEMMIEVELSSAFTDILNGLRYKVKITSDYEECSTDILSEFIMHTMVDVIACSVGKVSVLMYSREAISIANISQTVILVNQCLGLEITIENVSAHDIEFMDVAPIPTLFSAAVRHHLLSSHWQTIQVDTDDNIFFTPTIKPINPSKKIVQGAFGMINITGCLQQLNESTTCVCQIRMIYQLFRIQPINDIPWTPQQNRKNSCDIGILLTNGEVITVLTDESQDLDLSRKPGPTKPTGYNFCDGMPTMLTDSDRLNRAMGYCKYLPSTNCQWQIYWALRCGCCELPAIDVVHTTRQTQDIELHPSMFPTAINSHNSAFQNWRLVPRNVICRFATELPYLAKSFVSQHSQQFIDALAGGPYIISARRRPTNVSSSSERLFSRGHKFLTAKDLVELDQRHYSMKEAPSRVDLQVIQMADRLSKLASKRPGNGSSGPIAITVSTFESDANLLESDQTFGKRKKMDSAKDNKQQPQLPVTSLSPTIMDKDVTMCTQQFIDGSVGDLAPTIATRAVSVVYDLWDTDLLTYTQAIPTANSSSNSIRNYSTMIANPRPSVGKARSKKK